MRINVVFLVDGSDPVAPPTTVPDIPEPVVVVDQDPSNRSSSRATIRAAAPAEPVVAEPTLAG